MTDCAVWTAALIAIGVIITGFEDLCIDKNLFKKNLFDWRYCLALQPKIRPRADSSLADIIFGVTAFRASAILRIVGAVTTVALLSINPALAAAGVFLALLGYLYLFYRIPYSLDGSDQMCLFVLIGLSIMLIGYEELRYVRLGAAAILLQAAISYLTSGGAKLLSPIWRSGHGLAGIMSCAEYGNKYAAILLRNRPILNKLLSWGIIASHLFVGIVFLMGGPMVQIAITLALCFHLAVALLMRLNIFVWSFAATFPSALLMSDWTVRMELFHNVIGS